MGTKVKNDYSKSREAFKKNENTQGYCLWQAEKENFLLEGWNMLNTVKGYYEPHIVQLWDGDNGYSIYQFNRNP